MAKAFKFYYDLISQPSRALWIAFRLGKTSFDDCPVALRKKEHLSEEYGKINRFRKVPCIVDGDFHLAESVSIVRYLSDKDQFSTSLYPKEIQQRARVDEFLDWQHMDLRLGVHTYFMHMWLLPMYGLAGMPSAKKTAKLQEDMEVQLKVVENIWLKKTDFLTGNKMSVADLFAASELEQTILTPYVVGEKFPKIAEWIKKVREESNPFYDEAHKFLKRAQKLSSNSLKAENEKIKN